MSILTDLARPADDADRRRSRLVVTGLTAVGVVLLVAAAIALVTGDTDTGSYFITGRVDPRLEYHELAPYISQAGLRGGTVFGTVLLAVPVLTFVVQALRTGTAARERRFAALSLAGATRAQLRAVAVREVTRAAVRAALLVPPGYVVVWLLLGRAFPIGWRLVPDPTWPLAAAWAGIAVGLVGLGAVSSALAARVARVSPVGVRRRVPRPLGRRDAVLPLVAALLVAGGLIIAFTAGGRATFDIGLLVGLAGVVGLALSGGRWLVLAVARRSVGGGVVATLAGRRLLADVRAPGRAAGVLLAAGFALGAVGSLIAEVSADGDADGAFELVGTLIVGAGAVLAAAVACGALLVAATEQVLDGRRGIAVLVALAASPDLVQRVVRRQLELVAVPAITLGAVAGWASTGWMTLAGHGWALLGLPVASLAGWLGAALAARSVRRTIAACAGPENLRAP